MCVLDIFSKYAWVIPLKDKKGKPKKIWVDKGSEFYNNSFKKSLKDNNIEMHSIHNEGKSVVAERFIKTLKTKIYKYIHDDIGVEKCIYR